MRGAVLVTVLAGLALARCIAVDADRDGLPDEWEALYGRSTEQANSPIADPDLDGSPDWAEYRNATDPNDWDTDDDLLSDGEETYVYSLQGWSATNSSSRNGSRGDFEEMDSYLFGWHHKFAQPGQYAPYMPTVVAVPETGYYAFSVTGADYLECPRPDGSYGEGGMEILTATPGAIGQARMFTPGWGFDDWSWVGEKLQAGVEYPVTISGLLGDRMSWIRLDGPSGWLWGPMSTWRIFLRIGPKQGAQISSQVPRSRDGGMAI